MSGHKVQEQGNLFGIRNPGSPSNAYTVVREESNLTVVSATGAQTIGGGAAGDTHLLKIKVLVALTGTIVIAGFLDGAGNAQSLTIPAATPAGDMLFDGAINAAGALTITCANAADDNNVLVFWRPV